MEQQRPDIVLIMTDQQRFDTIAAWGYDHLDTPHLDRLVREGVSFKNCFVTAPTCAPSRASLFSGYFPHTTGVYLNADVWRRSWVEQLADAGYRCVNIGKMHTFPYETPLGFHERFVVENKDRYLEGRYFLDRWDMALQSRGLVKQQREQYRMREDYAERLGAFEWELPEETHSDMFVGDLAAWWLDTKPTEGPLFMQIGFPGPHPPFDPVPRYAEPYMQRKLPLPDVTRAELDAQPATLKNLRRHNTEVDHDSIVWSLSPAEEQLHRLRAYYYANITMIDEKLGGILAALERRGTLDNTLIVFVSDHGECLGDHGHIQKWNMFEASVKVPMIVWMPNRFAGGRSIDALCQHFDIAPVLMELAGVETPAAWEAQSLMPFLRGDRDACGREYVYSEQKADQFWLTGCRQITMIRNAEWKLVHYLGDAYGELYDLVRDPGEQRNVWNSEEEKHRQHKSRLLAQLLDWQLESGLRTAGRSESWR